MKEPTTFNQPAPIRVLVVDDEPMIHEAVAVVLEDCQLYRALDAASARRALDDLPELDVALVDKNLPDESGLSLIRDIKERQPDAEVIIITGFPSLDSAIEAIEVGAFDYIPKPFHASDLEIKVRNAGQKTRMRLRERQLAHQLLRSQRLEAMGKLAGSIAHDFNNLLTVYVAYAGLIEDSLEELAHLEEVQEVLVCVKEMEQATDAATRMTRQLLSFSKQQFRAPVILSINDVVEQVADLLRRFVEPTARLEIVLDPSVPPAELDRGQVQQLLINLVTNSRDAMPKGGTVTVETRRGHGTDGRDWAELLVRDTGEGIAADVVEHVFDPFFTTKGAKGTGLGLATVHSIVGQANGSIDVESSKGQGTLFTIRLPASDKAIGDTGGGSAQREERASGGERILVIEDDSAVRAVATRVLTKAGYVVSCVEDAATAFEKVVSAKQPIDLVLADVVLPGMSGPELAEQLAGFQAVTTIMHMSAYGAAAVVERGMLVDGIPFLPKPFTDERLLDAVRQALEFGKKTDGDAKP